MNTPIDTTPTLSGYRFTEQLYNGPKTVVYRGIRVTDSSQQAVVIKLFKREYPNFSELLQFRNQYTIAKNLQIPGIIRPYSLEPYRHSYALVMEDVGGRSLGSYIQHNPLSLTELLEIAIQLTTILHELYQNRVIHKDIKPANILIHPETKEIKLIDFSIASLLPKETEEVKHPNVLEGTLAYIAPEQTGRMNRGIDYRTDFYAFGVTLFELLTGQLPYESNDLMELVHCHIAKPAPSVCEIKPEIPEVVAQIVAKLMAKNAEDRYQSALGLKYDLEKCLDRITDTGQIEDFEIASRDISDRFTIPEKLYGREREVETLLAAFARISNGTSEMMLVAGFSGIGKTVVVNEVHKPIVRQRGYFVKGKFDQFNRNIPFWAFVQAFRDLMGQMLSESDVQLQVWKTQILNAVGANGQVIIEVIPELERIIGSQPPATELSGTAAQNRFNLLFQNFIKVFTKPSHPLVMFLDDLQWADSASLNLMQLLMSGWEGGYLLVIGAYRDNEVSPVHPLMLTLDTVVKAGATVNTITLQPLSQESLNHLIADALNCDRDLAKPLTELVAQKTQGNPFFATQFLKALHQDGLIEFDRQAGYWQCDIARVREAALTDDVVEFMALQLQKLPSATQDILKLAACIGNQFDLSTLAIVSEQSETETAAALWKGLQEGLILPQSETYKFFQSHESDDINRDRQIAVPYKFLHDRVQQAAYSLIPEDKKTATHLKIGQLLQQNCSEIELEEKLFDIVNHLNVGESLIAQPSKRTELAQLNLAAGRKAKLATAYSAAIAYCTTGIKLLARDCWREHYELTLALHESKAEVAYLTGEFAQMDAIASVTLKSAETLLDKIPTYDTQIQAYVAQNRITESIQVALNTLKQLGIKLPPNPTTVELLLGLAKTTLILGRKKTSDLLNLPTMSNPEKLATMRILASATNVAIITIPKLSSLLGFQQVNLSVQYGNMPLSAYTYSCHGTFLCGVLFDINKGYEFGQLALQILEKFNAQDMRSKVLVVVNGFILHWKQHLRSTLSTLQYAYQFGLETGNVESSAWAAVIQITHLYLVGQELSDLEKTLHYYGEAVEQLKQHLPRVYITIYHQAVLNLMGESSDPSMLDGSIYSETQNALQEASGDRIGLFSYYIIQTGLSYLFGEFSNAVKQTIVAKQYEDAGISLALNVPFCLYDSLARLALYPTATKTEQKQILRHVTQNQKKLQKWASFAPMNSLHKFHLVEAERYRVLGQWTKAQDLYDRAISGAQANEYIQEEALANELAAKFYLDWGKAKIAQVYMQSAYYCYARWGAKAKTDDLEKHYPQLLQPILQSSPNPKLNATIHQTQTIGTTSSTSSVLDLATAIKASQAISGEIQLSALICQMMNIILENAGADLATLILNNSGTWEVVAQSLPEHNNLSSIPLEKSENLPHSIINSVKRSQQSILINEVAKEPSLAADPYFLKQQPKSLFCTPIFNQGKLVGILYLENNLTVGAFTESRLEILNLLTSQAAISIENAQLYNTLEQKVIDRTTQLSQALDTLKATQKQLVESEKMAALGGLVAGVAHEINTPIGTSITVASTLADETKIFSQAVAQGQLKRSLLTNYLELAEESTQLMLGNLHRAGALIQNFKQIATDQEYLEQRQFNLKSYLEEIALSLAPKLKQTPHTLSVAGDETLTIESYPGALAQIATNLVMNSLAHAYPTGEPGQLRFEVYPEGQQINIVYSDDGCGIEPENLGKIFEPFFTTARHQGGTGLGLNIVYNLVRQKLQGTIAVNSEVGLGTRFIITLA